MSPLLDCPRETKNTRGESSSDSSNLQLAVIIIYAILLVLILLLVLICLLIRRRALCFSKIRKHQNPDNNLHVEVQDLENNEEPEYEVCYYFAPSKTRKTSISTIYKPKQCYV